MTSWFLEGFVDERRDVWRTPLRTFPFQVGRREGSDMRLGSPEVSGSHAELLSRGGGLWLRDLGSKNGSFVNDDRIDGDLELHAGDVMRFANWEFRLVSALETTQSTQSITQTVALPSSVSPANLARRISELRSILENDRLIAYFQPIVRLDSEQTIAYEALARGIGDDGSIVPPVDLFDLAAGLNKESELSLAMRRQALRDATDLPSEPRVVFVNTHPSELAGGVDPLLRSLEELVRSARDVQIVLEIHEAAVASSSLLTDLGRGVASLGIDVAFDDFGTGQARLLELAEVAPRYLKFDRAWISGVDQATRLRIDMLSSLVTMVRALGVLALAEGVETAQEAAVCSDLGFELAQGYYFGRPAPAADFLVS